MKKIFSSIIGLIVILVVAATVFGFIYWSRIPDLIATELSKKMKVAVSIDSIDLSWNEIDVKKVKIGNLPNSILAKAFSCNVIEVHTPVPNYLKPNIIIDEIDLKDVYLGLEFDSPSGTKGNWTRIMSTITASMNESSKSAKAAPTGSTRSVLIHRLVLTNIDVDVVYKKDGAKIKRLPRIERMVLNEISSEGGLPMDQILNSVLGEMLKQVFLKENLKNMMQEFMDVPSPIQQYIAPFKGLF
jgi:hypothetical protein